MMKWPVALATLATNTVLTEATGVDEMSDVMLFV